MYSTKELALWGLFCLALGFLCGSIGPEQIKAMKPNHAQEVPLEEETK